jgi:hypothetical protein
MTDLNSRSNRQELHGGGISSTLQFVPTYYPPQELPEIEDVYSDVEDPVDVQSTGGNHDSNDQSSTSSSLESETILTGMFIFN